MITAFTAYIKTITALAIFSALTELLLPDSRERRYAQLVLGIFMLTAVLHPLFCLMKEVPTVQREWHSEYLEQLQPENAWELLDTYNHKKYE